MSQLSHDQFPVRRHPYLLVDHPRARTKAPIRGQYETQGHSYYSSARLWDDAVIDPAETRRVLALGLSASLNAPIPETRFGLFISKPRRRHAPRLDSRFHRSRNGLELQKNLRDNSPEGRAIRPPPAARRPPPAARRPPSSSWTRFGSL
jgi:hypothetical protein